MQRAVIVLFFLLGANLSAQGLFENALKGEPDEKSILEINGYFRGVVFSGLEEGTGDAELKSGYGEAALLLRARAGRWGDGFAEIRFRQGMEFDERFSELDLVEAYTNVFAGPLDLRIGHQIVVWGRADGLNPTDNITPKDMLVRSPDEDDRLTGNFLLRARLNFHPFRLEGIWVPAYAMSSVPTGLVPLPFGMAMDDPMLPDMDLANSAYALKAELTLPAADGSVSYFNGYNPFPGIDATEPAFSGGGLTMSAFPRAYRMQVWGADFSTTFGSFGLRGEAAYRIPYGDYEAGAYLPYPDWQAVLGVDTQKGDFSMILQYIGRYVPDFSEPGDPPSIISGTYINYELIAKNRMLAGQQDRFRHGMSLRPALTLFHENLKVELLGLYYFTTDELMLRPKVTYFPADAMSIVLGAEYYSGTGSTLFGLIDRALSSVFIELRLSY